MNNDKSSCRLNELPKNRQTYIHPGGNTGCLTGSPYRFQVSPGTISNKMLLYFHKEAEDAGILSLLKLCALAAQMRQSLHKMHPLGSLIATIPEIHLKIGR
jgi:hypothetical protein